MEGSIISKYKKLNFNLKNIIFNHLDIIQIIRQITKVDKSTLFALEKNRVINFIKNNYNRLKEWIPELISKSIERIKEICTSDSNLTQNNIDQIIIYLFVKIFSSCQKLDLSYNSFRGNEKYMMYLSEVLKINTSLKEIDLSQNNLGANEKNMMYLKEALQINTSIQILDLSRNNLGKNEKNMIYLTEALKNNNSIQELDLFYNYLGKNEKNMLCLSEALKINNSIQKLNLWGNDLEKPKIEDFLKQFVHIKMHF